MWGDIIIAFLLAFITAYVITPYTMRLAKKVGAIDMPSDRRINKRPMPRLGGIAVISGFVVSVIYLLTSMVIEGGFGLMEHVTEIIGFFCGIAVLGVVCFIDDCKDIHPLLKLLAQTISAIIVVACGINIENMDSPVINNIIQAHPWFSYILTVFWIVGITNAINLIDGLDGLSSGITLISCISLMIVFTINESPLLSIILITALAGAIIGFSLAVISILGVAKTYTAIVIVAPIIVLGLPIFDTLFAIVRRIYQRKSLKGVFMPDKGHLHHRLMARGYTQKEAVFILYGFSAILGVFAIVLLESGVWKAVSFAMVVSAIIAVGYKDITRKADLNKAKMKRMEERNKKDSN